MRTLNNDVFRSESMQEFLTAMGMDLEGVTVNSIEGLFGFSFTKESVSKHFATRLTKSLSSTTPPQVITLASIIDAELEQAKCTKEIDKASCKAILELIKAQAGQFYFSQETGEVTIDLPSPAYVPLLNSLSYPHMRFTAEGKLTIDIKHYIEDLKTPETIIQLTGLNKEQLPVIFLNSELLASKEMYYATKPLDEGNVEVTPYFFVPTTPVPPTYHFILDTSGSMGDDLGALKDSVLKLVEQLFRFQPTAQIKITTFSNAVKLVGDYTQSTLEQLIKDVKGIIAKGSTALCEVMLQALEQLKSESEHHNFLLFSDGQPSDARSKGNELINTLMNIKSDSLKCSNNKFYVFSYREKVKAHDSLNLVTQVFASELIQTSSPDFVQALENPASLEKWAAARELFYTRVRVKNNVGLDQVEEDTVVLERSGQITALPARVCKEGEQLTIIITDSKNNLIVENTTQIAATQPPISNAKAIGALGINQTKENGQQSTASHRELQQTM